MDCEEVSQLLDAYALGAAEADEGASLEEHVADCVRCWSSLNEAQRAAAAIALSAAFQRAPPSLRARILAETERGERLAAPKLRELLRRLWPVGAGIVGAGAAASLAFALVLQTEVSDLRDENDQLGAQVQDAGELITEQRQLMTVLAAADVQHLPLEATDPASSAVGVYHWSPSARAGALLCNNLPPPEEGQTYKVWLLTDSGAYDIGSFESWNGIGQVSVDLGSLPEPPLAIGMSLEYPDAETPGEMFLFAEFER